MGENLKVIWAEFSNQSNVVLQGTAWQVRVMHAASSRGCIFSCVQPFYEQAVSDLDP
jgi:hypothetical protein